MFEHKWFRFALGSLGLLVWLACYALARFGGRDMRRWGAPARVAAILLLAAWAGFWATDHVRMADIFQLNFWGFYCAGNWLIHHYRVADDDATITRLNLLPRSSPDSGATPPVR